MGPSWAQFVEGWSLYRDPILCAAICGAVLGWLGVHVVLRRMVFVTAAVSQAAGLGVAVAFWAAMHLPWAISPVLGASGVALLVAAALALPVERWGLSRAAWLGAAYVATWAGAVLVGDRIAQQAHDVSSILFGSAVLVEPAVLHAVALGGLIVLATHLVLQPALVLCAFDPDGARVQGVPVRVLEVVSWTGIAAFTAIATRALGVLPVFAFAVLPPMAALALGRRVQIVLPLSASIGLAAGVLGYLLAFFGELPVGASQAAVSASMLPIALSIRALTVRVKTTGAPGA
ncbi:MAG: metal ABC transporter permease [Myxococcota bacterium]|nr:metal ABC transporter permease [Myxococcota bacterium]MDW8363545.1 metal ABC transporter permease [Myxococcales bacterium]